MRQQSFLVRKGARYHFRRRLPYENKHSRSISISLNTADPVNARRLARRLAVRWDEIAMYVVGANERGTLTIKEQEALFRRGLEDELARATAHLTAPIGEAVGHPAHHKVMAAVLRIVARVPHDATAAGAECVEAELDESWTAPELRLLRQTLSVMVTPMTVSRSAAKEALEELGTPTGYGTLREARSQLFRGMAEAHRRAALLEHPVVSASARGVVGLLDDALIAQALASDVVEQSTSENVPAVPPHDAPEHGTTLAEHAFFVKATPVRFSEQLQELHDAMFETKGWQPDGGKALHMLEVFAWLTGDKAMSDYRPSDVNDYARRLARIPLNFKWGRLGVSGEMAVPFDPERITALPKKAERRSDRTLNSHFSKMEIAAKILMDSHWLPRYGHQQAITFGRVRKSIPNDDSDPTRVPLTEQNLRALYGLPLWQGGGGSNHRLKAVSHPKVFQDGAYWVPLFGTYMGISREEGCGVEAIDFEFDAVTPYMLIRANMTKSKDGETPAGLKRLTQQSDADPSRAASIGSPEVCGDRCCRRPPNDLSRTLWRVQ